MFSSMTEKKKIHIFHFSFEKHRFLFLGPGSAATSPKKKKVGLKYNSPLVAVYLEKTNIERERKEREKIEREERERKKTNNCPLRLRAGEGKSY